MHSEPDPSEPQKKASAMAPGTGIAIGLAVGTALGAAFDDIAIGTAVGIAIGAAVDSTAYVNNKNHSK